MEWDWMGWDRVEMDNFLISVLLSDFYGNTDDNTVRTAHAHAPTRCATATTTVLPSTVRTETSYVTYRRMRC
jgi:hypothetical protein